MAELLQKVNRNEKSICGKCSHRFVCFGIKNQPCFECNRFEEELVRCKDCKMEYGCRVAQWLGENGFCSYGERKSE